MSVFPSAVNTGTWSAAGELIGAPTFCTVATVGFSSSLAPAWHSSRRFWSSSCWSYVFPESLPLGHLVVREGRIEMVTQVVSLGQQEG